MHVARHGSLACALFLAVARACAALIPSADGRTVYDTALEVNWLADADLAASAAAEYGVSDIGPSGEMDFATARRWVEALDGAHSHPPLFGHADWMLPTAPTSAQTDPTCSATGPDGSSSGYGCSRSALGSLYYRTLGLRGADRAVPTGPLRVGPFRHLQPGPYWACAAPDPRTPCQEPAGTAMQWSFSFGSGLQETAPVGKRLYVTVYYPLTPPAALTEAIDAALAGSPAHDAFIALAAELESASTPADRAQSLAAFVGKTEVEGGTLFSAAQVRQLVDLAQANFDAETRARDWPPPTGPYGAGAR
jgi:hypothetical protein